MYPYLFYLKFFAMIVVQHYKMKMKIFSQYFHWEKWAGLWRLWKWPLVCKQYSLSEFSWRCSEFVAYNVQNKNVLDMKKMWKNEIFTMPKIYMKCIKQSQKLLKISATYLFLYCPSLFLYIFWWPWWPDFVCSLCTCAACALWSLESNSTDKKGR